MYTKRYLKKSLSQGTKKVSQLRNQKGMSIKKPKNYVTQGTKKVCHSRNQESISLKEPKKYLTQKTKNGTIKELKSN